jgi:filamentous hemagglutinin
MQPRAFVRWIGRLRGRARCSGFVIMTTAAVGTATPATLPVPCVAGNCGQNGPGFVTSGTAFAQQSGNKLTINNLSNSAILNWASFNVSANGQVQFVQPGAASIALNRIFQASPSSILGSITANGQIYLVNPNGFVFGPNSTVNVASLLASSLNISDAIFAQGILSPALLRNIPPTPALESDGRTSVLDGQGNPVLGSNGQPIPVQIVVDPGAQLNAASGGRVMLASQAVTNGGGISAPDGQVVLAAGAKVYLEASGDPTLRGLIVEVDSGGTAWNQLTGTLSAGAGNVSMVGLAVNQDGRISATTTVSANGSVSLVAADTTAVSIVGGGNVNMQPTHGGNLELGPQSSIEIAPDSTSTATAVRDQPQLQSSVTLVGQQIVMHSGAQIDAPAGLVTATAVADPGFGVNDPNPQSQLRIDSGASINVEGSTAQLPVSDNIVAVQLNANQLADDPVNRNGFLHGQTVYVDARVAAPNGAPGTAVADVSSAIAAVPESVAYRTTAGGTVTLESEGDVVVAKGATINVSGGQVDYSGGVVATTQLIASNGQTYDIGQASPSLTYVGLINPSFTQTYTGWGVTSTQSTPGAGRYEPGYVQGAPAGTIQVAGTNIVLNGALLGSAYNGPYQRTPATLNPGGQLEIGLSQPLLNNSANEPDYLAPAVQFTAQPPVIVVADGAPFPGQQTLDLPTTYLSQGGFTRTAIYSNDSVTLPGGLPLSIAAGGSLVLSAPRITIDSNITAPGGVLQFTTADTIADPAGSDPLREGLAIGGGVALDVRGLWTNDMLDVLAGLQPVGQTAQGGGTINLTLGGTAGELSLGTGSALEASGGAWLASSGAVTGGAGGKIVLSAGGQYDALQIGRGVSLDAFGGQFAQGGTFSLTNNRLEISQGNSWSGPQTVDELNAPGVLQLYSGLFAEYGFSNVNLVATGPAATASATARVLTVDPDTQILAEQSNLLLQPQYLNTASAASIFGFASVALLPAYQRPVASVSLNYAPLSSDTNPTAGQILIGAGADIMVDPQGAITLSSLGNIDIEGGLHAAAGQIGVVTPQPSGTGLVFFPDQGIVLGPHAILDASGVAIYQPSTGNGLEFGSVLPGGSVELLAQNGNLTTDAGSKITVAGISAPIDLINAANGYSIQNVGTAGGAVDLVSAGTMELAGGINAAAGAGATRAAGGALTIGLQGTTSPSGTREIEIGGGSGALPASAASDGAFLTAPALEATGAGSLTLQATYTTTFVPTTLNEPGALIELDSGVSLSMSQSLTLDAPALGMSNGTATLRAPAVTLTNSTTSAVGGAGTGGTATLNVQASFIDLLGSQALQGIGTATLASSGDLRLDSLFYPAGSGVQYLGGLNVGGNLTLDAARVYPSTLSQFTLATSAPNGVIAIGQTSASPGAPLSAAGSVTVQADQILNSGSLYAPFGQLSLQASDSLTLAPGSVTSVSANGLVIPFGNVQNSAFWIYQNGNTVQSITAIPARQVSLSAPSLSIQKGATVDLRGGGDLYAYEWVPGTGGSTDALANSATSGLYAILPQLRGQYAPYDPEEFATSGLQTGASVYLSGGGGLAAGVYPLLPARYALLPGAFLVEQVAGSQGKILPGLSRTLSDGTPEAAGYLTFGDTGLGAPLYSAFAIYPGSYGRQLADYQDSFASTFFSQAASQAGLPAPALPADAGALSVSVTAGAQSQLTILGQVLTQAASGGAAAAIDISAANIDVVASAGGSVPAGSIQLIGSVLQSWDAGQLVLGGQRSADGSSISVTADDVTVSKGVTLSGQEIILVAGSTIEVQSGATVASNSGLKLAPAPASAPVQTSVILDGPAGGSAALLAVSDTELPIGSRIATSGPAGTVTLESGASLASAGAIAVEGPGAITLSGSMSVSGASVSLATSDIRFGSNSGPTEGLSINSSLVATLQQSQSLRLAAANSIDLMSNTSLGVSTGGALSLGTLILIANTLNGAPGVEATLGAKSLTLQGLGGSSTATGGTAQLTLVTDGLTVADGTIALNGFGVTNAQVAGTLSGSNGGVIFGGNAVLNAAALVGGNGSELTLSAPNGTLSLGRSASSTSVVPGLGALVSLSAPVIDDETAIIVPSGEAILSSADALSLGASAVIDASGRTVSIVGQTANTPGGAVGLNSGGALTVASGARITVAGAPGADAGSVSLTGTGLVSLAGTFSGVAGGGARGGSFSLDAGQLAGTFGALAGAVQTGGFSTSQIYRVRSGDLALGAGETLTANQVELVADSGNIEVAGTISAPSADLRGSIELFAGQNIELLPTGQLLANSSGLRGGAVELGSSGGQITLDPGSVVSAAGTQQLGTLTLRAPSVGTDDVAISPLSEVNLSNLSQVIVEPLLTTVLSTDATSTTLLDAPTMGNIEAATAAYMADAVGVIGTRLAAPASTLLTIEPAVELQSTGAVTVSDALDLSTWRFGTAPVDLTVRAAGPLNVLANISDGQQPGTVNASSIDLLPGQSSSVSLVAGADLTSANPLATSLGVAADLTLGAGVIVTTGTGNINLAAARDVIFAGPGATVYTTGVPGAPTTAVDARLFSLTAPTSGGNVLISAGQDILGSPISQSISDWQIRVVPKKSVTALWGVDLSQFDQLGYNVATLGGGDVALTAGGNIMTLSAAAADSRALVNGAPVFFPSGGLVVSAHGDIDSSQFYLADGSGKISADGALGSAFNDGYLNLPVGTLLAQGNSQLTVAARGDVLLAADVNPTIIDQPLVPISSISNFLTYGSASSLNVMSVGGTVTLNPDAGALQTLLGLQQADDTNPSFLELIPGTLKAAALGGDLAVAGSFTLMPSTQGQLSLLAFHDLIGGASGSFVTMSDAPAGLYPTIQNPTVEINGNAFTPYGALHVGDTQPAIVAAGEDITGLGFQLPKAALISAGRDIVNLDFVGQNLSPTDTTVLSAGRDIVEQPNQTDIGISVGGPGALDLFAGRNIDLGESQGVATTGRLVDPDISDPNGSSVTLWAGLATAPNASEFISDIVAKSASLQPTLIDFMEQQSGQMGLTFAQAQAAFLALPFIEQEPFIAETFFGQLLQSGLAASTANAGYAQGYAAIDALFPGSRSSSGSNTPYQGDIQLPFSRIYTISGGDISILAPGGLLNVGLANAPVGVPARTPSQLGIVAQGSGSVQIYSSGDVDVNASRIFTLLGGDIQIWSDEGSIDAGRGSKTAISAPPPTVTVDASGNVTLNFSAAVAGSGIRTIMTEPGVNPGNVYLIAPLGTVNAGDAGIGAAGDLYVSAAHVVVGVGGFTAGGTQTGVPPAVSGLGASLSGASSSASSATNVSSNTVAGENATNAAAAPLASSALSWLDVFIEGFGSENCKPDDVECLKRNANK